jgi:energy-coupling factor transport system ATP-binding protein
MSDPILTVERLRFRYPETVEPALNDVNLSIGHGEYVGISGAAGAGKSTLCMALCGCIPHLVHGELSGKVVADGLVAAESTIAELARHIGIVLQDPESQLFSLSVFADVTFGLENLKLPREAVLERAEWALEMVGMADSRDRPSASLSGGQKQRVAIACTLAMGSDVIVLDEPTSELDPQGTEEVFRVLDELHRRGTTVVVAEQKVGELVKYVDRLVYLRKGRVLLDLPPQAFFAATREWYARGEADMLIPQVAMLAYELDRAARVNVPPPITIPQFVDWFGHFAPAAGERSRADG